MKNIVLRFGLIAGAMLSAMMLVTIPFQDAIGYDRGEVIGYTSMVLAFLLIFFGVRSYRDNVAGGTVRFGRAFAVGISIAAVASLCYVATWEVLYFKFMPDFATKYQTHILDKARANGESADAIAKRQADAVKFAKWYNVPVLNAAVTFLEPLPVALIVSLLTAGVLSRRKKQSVGEDGLAASARASM